MGVFSRKKGQPQPSRAALLDAVAVRHPGVKEHPGDDGTVTLALGVPKNRLGRWLSRSDAPVTRRFQLDELGSQAWRMMEERLTVREIIQRFASAHHLNLREAEVAMLSYLRSLTRRGIMILVMPESPEKDA